MAENDKLRRLRDWIMARWPDAYTETAVDRRIVREIDRLLAEDEPEKPGDEFIYKLGHMLDQKIETLRAVLRDGRNA